jgi:multiple sugar transport system permease protein
MLKRLNFPGDMRIREEFNAWLFVLPTALGLLIFQLFPVLFSLYVSFTNWNLITPPKWLGFQNYRDLFTIDPFFVSTLRNTVLYAVGTVSFSLFFAILVALLLNQQLKGKEFFRAVFFLPVVLPTASAALAWTWMYDANAGIINSFLKLLGLAPIPWLVNTNYALWALIIEAIWASLGFNTIIFLAGLQNISKDYYEAASIDGANAWQKFVNITLPLLSPTTFFVLVTSIINAVQIFDLPFIMTGGGPANATQTIVMYIYSNAFRLQRMGLASAVGYMVFIIILGLTYLNFKFEKKWVFYEEAV